MTAKHTGYAAPRNRSRRLNLLSYLIGFALSLCTAVAFSGAPYDITVNFDPPLTGGAPASYNLYIDDCAITGPVAAPFASVTTGQTFVSALVADGTYDICVRPVNATGELADPGPVATIVGADLPLPGPVENLDIQVTCPTGGCTVNVTVN